MSETKSKIKLQTITIVNPNDQTQQAVLNIWFIGKDIVIDGIGWYEYYDYEKLQKIKPLQLSKTEREKP